MGCVGETREPLEEALTAAISRLPVPASSRDASQRLHAGTTLTGERLLALFDDQVTSRALDLAARWLRGRGAGFYTIGSSGHEGNSGVAAALRPTDPALLHYRSGGFYVTRARQLSGHDPVRDVLLGMLAGRDEPIAGGRHKVFGHHDLAVIPQTSTIASHLPRALGVAFSIGRGPKLGAPLAWPSDALAVCSFGDASANHSTATGAINTACNVAYRNLPLPLLLVCEDNGFGISVRTAPGWIETAYGHRTGLRYEQVDGADVVAVHDVTAAVADWVRTEHRPAFLHLRTVRFLGHAGTDVEAGYRPPDEIRRDYERDPILGTARLLVGAGVATQDAVLARYETVRQGVFSVAESLVGTPTLVSAEEVMAPLLLRSPDRVADVTAATGDAAARRTWFGGTLPEDEGPLTLAQSINRALADVLFQHPGLLVFGEDVAAKGGVYGLTRGLQKKAGGARVFDTVLDEQSILGLALGAGVSGLLPVPEVQYLAYLHNAEDQLRGEAATLSFFSNGQYRNPLVVRIAGYGYQKGFGGHFHNDDAVGVLRDVPGLVVASPARPADAAALLRTCVAAAAVDGTVCVFLEPIALYHTQDLHEPGDRGWLDPYPAAPRGAVGEPRIHGTGTDLLIVTWGNGLYLSLRVARRLAAAAVHCRVLDLRWLAPLPIDAVVSQAREVGRVLVVDETRRSGGVSEGIVAGLVDQGFAGPMARVTSKDSFVPLGDAALAVLVSEDEIHDAACRLVRA
jgi:2-oxoisovalerate dehydrogenase E1 component